MSFSKALKFLNSDPLNPLKMCSFKFKNRCLNFAVYGQKEPSKVEYVAIYFHATPMCRLEPNLHSSEGYGNIYEKMNIRLYCFERPGFGESSLCTKRNVAEFVNDVSDALESEEFNFPSASSKVLNIGYSAGGPYAITFHKLFPKKVMATAIIASSVSAHMDMVYRKSLRGTLESFFFSSPVLCQEAFHFASIQLFLCALKVPIYLMSLLQFISPIVSTASSKRFKRIALKLKTISDVMHESVRVHGAKGVVVDTIATQSSNEPWYNSASVKLKDDHPDNIPPPIALYYSKEDSTVPWSAGVRLAEQLGLCTSEQPKFLDGGHACFYLNLHKILHDLMHLRSRKCSQ